MSGSEFPRVVVVVLHWRTMSRRGRRSRSLEKITYPNCSVVVVDNFSANGSVERLQQEFRDCRFDY